MLFASIVGHKLPKQYLLNLGKKAPNSLLFTGPPGSASMTLALAYATYLHCTDPLPNDACGTCISCHQMERLTHADLHFAFPIGSTQQIKNKEVSTTQFLSVWRNFLLNNPYGGLQAWSKELEDSAKILQIGKSQVQTIKHLASVKPLVSAYHTVVIWLPELLHPVASNALLKTLEEPSAHIVFILVSLDSVQLLPTIHSRTLSVYIPPFSYEDMVLQLRDYFPSMDTRQIQALAQIAQGDFNKAKALSVTSIIGYFEEFIAWLRGVYIQNWSRVLAVAERFYALPLQRQKNWVMYGLELIRSTLLLQFDLQGLVGLREEELHFCKKLAEKLTTEHLYAIIACLEKAYYNLTRNANGQLMLLSISIDLTKFINPARS